MTSQPDRFANAYLDLRARLLAYFLKEVGERAIAEDLLHDVFVRAQTRGEQLRDLAQLEGWIFGIARNALLDWRRRRRTIEEIDPELAAPMSDEPPVDLSASVRWFVRQLPERYREPLILVELRGMSVKTAAEKLGISYTAAKTRVRRARGLLLDSMLRCCRLEADAYGNIIECEPRADACQTCDCEQEPEERLLAKSL